MTGLSEEFSVQQAATAITADWLIAICWKTWIRESMCVGLWELLNNVFRQDSSARTRPALMSYVHKSHMLLGLGVLCYCGSKKHLYPRLLHKHMLLWCHGLSGCDWLPKNCWLHSIVANFFHLSECGILVFSSLFCFHRISYWI